MLQNRLAKPQLKAQVLLEDKYFSFSTLLPGLFFFFNAIKLGRIKPTI
jgi:hypothetical protein